jgi:hypothetical protein
MSSSRDLWLFELVNYSIEAEYCYSAYIWKCKAVVRVCLHHTESVSMFSAGVIFEKSWKYLIVSRTIVIIAIFIKKLLEADLKVSKMQSSVARDRQIRTLEGIRDHPMGHLIGAKILSALEYDDFLNMEYILCPPGAGPFDTIISDIRCSEILNKMERDVDRNIMFVRRDFEIKYKKES